MNRPTPSSPPGTPVPLAVWPVAQIPITEQRAGRYLATTLEPSELTPPALAEQIVTTYSRPGQLVCDPMCGTGTILAEATRGDRAIAGLDISETLVDAARLNVAIARFTTARPPMASASLPGAGEIACGDARSVTELVTRADLVVLHPPAPGPPRATDSRRDNRRGTTDGGMGGNAGDPGDLAALRPDVYWSQLTEIAAAARTITAPGGYLVLTVHGYQRAQQHLDSAAAAIAAAQHAGWSYQQHVVAVLAPLRGDRITPPADHTAPTRRPHTPRPRPPRPPTQWGARGPARGPAGYRPPTPALHELVHCDVLVFTTTSPASTTRGTRAASTASGKGDGHG